MVSAGYLGKKSGQGFYTYTAQPPPPPQKERKDDGTDADPPYGNAEGDVDVGLGRLLLKSIGVDKKQ